MNGMTQYYVVGYAIIHSGFYILLKEILKYLVAFGIFFHEQFQPLALYILVNDNHVYVKRDFGTPHLVWVRASQLNLLGISVGLSASQKKKLS